MASEAASRRDGVVASAGADRVSGRASMAERPPTRARPRAPGRAARPPAVSAPRGRRPAARRRGPRRGGRSGARGRAAAGGLGQGVGPQGRVGGGLLDFRGALAQHHRPAHRLGEAVHPLGEAPLTLLGVPALAGPGRLAGPDHRDEVADVLAGPVRGRLAEQEERGRLVRRLLAFARPLEGGEFPLHQGAALGAAALLGDDLGQPGAERLVRRGAGCCERRGEGDQDRQGGYAHRTTPPELRSGIEPAIP